jgi:hypothetical protein
VRAEENRFLAPSAYENISVGVVIAYMHGLGAITRKDSMMPKKEKRPTGWRKFDALTRKLIQVPKEEADAQIEADKKRRKKK